MQDMLDDFLVWIRKDTCLPPLQRYIVLLGCLALIAADISRLLITAPLKISTAGISNNLAVSLMILLNDVAFGFPWAHRTRVFLRVWCLVASAVLCIIVISRLSA
jgi:hypothetical protein